MARHLHKGSRLDEGVHRAGVEQRQGIKISAPEEIAYKYGWITKEKLLESAARYGKSPYGQHLKNVADDKLQY